MMRFLTPNEYLPKVESIYRQLHDDLQFALPFAEVDHVGSSAIHGAISKGDLDVLVRVAKNQFAESLDKIKALGFKEKEGTLRTDSLCMLVTEKYNWDVAVQLIEKGSEFEMFIRFRDRLNADPDLVNEYNKLKLDSAGLPAEEYRKKKSAFIERVLS